MQRGVVSQAAPLGTIPISFAGGDVIASSLPPGTNTYWLGEESFGTLIYSLWDEIPDTDANGSVTFDLGVPPWPAFTSNSLWIVVDDNGHYGINFASSLAVPHQLTDFGIDSSGHLRIGGADYASIMWVRPGVGSWTLTLDDNRPGDISSETNVMIAVPGSFEPTVAAPVPSSFAAGDILVAVYPFIDVFGPVETYSLLAIPAPATSVPTVSTEQLMLLAVVLAFIALAKIAR